MRKIGKLIGSYPNDPFNKYGYGDCHSLRNQIAVAAVLIAARRLGIEVETVDAVSHSYYVRVPGGSGDQAALVAAARRISLRAAKREARKVFGLETRSERIERLQYQAALASACAYCGFISGEAWDDPWSCPNCGCAG